MIVVQAVLVTMGLVSLAALLVIGAVALVRDLLAERADRRRLTEIVQQVRRDLAERGEQRDDEPPA